MSNIMFSNCRSWTQWQKQKGHQSWRHLSPNISKHIHIYKTALAFLHKTKIEFNGSQYKCLHLFQTTIFADQASGLRLKPACLIDKAQHAFELQSTPCSAKLHKGLLISEYHAHCILHTMKFKSTKVLAKDLDLQKTLSMSSIDKSFFPTPVLPHLAEGSLATSEYRSDHLVCAAHRFGTRLSLYKFEEASVSWQQCPTRPYPRWLLVTYQKYSYRC